MSDQVPAQPIGGWPLDEPFPALLTDTDLMRVFRLKHSRFYLLKKRGKFRCLEARPQLLAKTRYSGAVVRRYVNGESVTAMTFGRKRSAA